MQDRVGSRLEQEAPSSLSEEFPLVPSCSAPTHLHSGASLAAGTGQFFRHRDTNVMGTSQASDTPLHQASSLCQLLTPLKTLPSAAGGAEGMAWEAAMPLLTCFLKQLTSLE